MSQLGFVGLGVMGSPMAMHLVRTGDSVMVFNRSPGKAEEHKKAGAKLASNLIELATSCDIICLCVNRSEDVRECVEEMSPHAKPGTVFVDHSTIAPTVAVEIAEYLKSRQQSLVDAPVTGGSMGAQKGQLTVFCGGSEADVEKVKPFLAAYAKRCERVGPSGSGQMMKLVNQIAVGGALLALCEALSFAAKGGLDVAQARDLVGSGAAGSWAFDNYGPKILAKDWRPGFSIVNQRKDFAYTIEAAEALRAAVPGTKLVDQLLSELENQGRGQDTTAALFELMLKLEQ